MGRRGGGDVRVGGGGGREVAGRVGEAESLEGVTSIEIPKITIAKYFQKSQTGHARCVLFAQTTQALQLTDCSQHGL